MEEKTNSEFAERLKKKKFDKTSFKKALKLLSFVLPYKWAFVIGIVFLVLSTSTTLTFPSLIGEVTRVIEGNSDYSLNQIVLFFGGILILQGIFSFLRVYIFSYVSQNVSADVRRRVFNKLISLPINFYEKNRVGDLISRITSDVSSFQSILSVTLAELFRQIVTLIVGIAIILYISWKLTLFMLLTFPIVVVAAFVFGRYIRVFSRKVQEKLADSNAMVSETLQSISVVKGFTNEKIESEKYDESMSDVVALSIKSAIFRGGFISFSIVGLFGGIMLVVWYGGGLVFQGEIQLADLMSFLFYTAFIGASVNGLGDIYSQIQSSVGASERILEILDEDSEVNLDKSRSSFKVKGAIEYKNVAFAYPSRTDLPIFKDFSLSIKPGEKIALVGQSGAGKSTVVQLLLRFYEIDGGQILIDGESISGQDVTELRQNMAIVPQEVILFGGTIKENINYGRLDATDEEIREAAQKANALEFIDRFPEGLDTIVGERGVKLSGGQRQRIAIARAILKDPAILLLDEATSALDSESESLVQEALDELMKNRTTIIIAHRLGTVKNVDQIYVLNEGTVAEQGKHEDLILNPDGIYSNLVKLQMERSTLES
ncbi:ABC transporter ATP-binding protein [Arcticibacterium luteifluviistationis]|uniref:Multidrug ABC transporter ATP-binding protein n=1 Tax=Arcticibacterium luteifluviistationis TaxID=1784714 RepID=A0A2Z4GEM0_9BACT|nr:ABC transporter transmembrane domain-containing protein [Arcticibacterium luteifluviistationis]AWV99782.1 multidrug ABC transporter ATP-binding protein [Arcticibacterium luteifluviistationis]